jgi:membrane fusion protein (multidrug efflux system)
MKHKSFSGLVSAGRSVAMACILLTQACSNETAPSPPPTPVKVLTVGRSSAANAIELPGRVEAVRSVQVRARVDGIVLRRLYEEGTDVAAGTALFQIDPSDVQAQMRQAEAGLTRALATQSDADQVVKRFSSLIGRQAISEQEYESARNHLRQAEADVQDARAAVDRSKLVAGYATVRAPIAGRVGRAQVSEGALVSAASGTLMTQVDQLSQVYVVFTKSSSDLLDLARRVRAGEVRLPDLLNIDVRLITEDGQDYGVVGHLDYAGLVVQPGTGSQTLRAVFPNPRRDLLPGQFVRGVLQAGTFVNVLSVPERAVMIGVGDTSVIVVGADNVAERRIVSLGESHDGMWIVRSGLKAGERIVVEGWQTVVPGQKVAPQPIKTPQQPPSSGSSEE